MLAACSSYAGCSMHGRCLEHPALIETCDAWSIASYARKRAQKQSFTVPVCSSWRSHRAIHACCMPDAWSMADAWSIRNAWSIRMLRARPMLGASGMLGACRMLGASLCRTGPGTGDASSIQGEGRGPIRSGGYFTARFRRRRWFASEEFLLVNPVFLENLPCCF